MSAVVAIDAGTTGVRAIAIDETGAVRASSYRELTQHYPRPGWVEHDPLEIWRLAGETVLDVISRLGTAVAAIGITNQRETVVAWDRRDGTPLHPAIVWQDRRTAARTGQLEEDGYLPLVRSSTGLVLDPYFSASKAEWLIHNLGLGGEATRRLALGTIDAWLVWNLTGGPAHGVHATDLSNASRTMLFDIRQLRWSDELCELFSVPQAALPQVRPSCGRMGLTAGDTGLPAGIPVSGAAGDQHAALFGQACIEPGMAKATYGTGSFVLMNMGPRCPEPVEGLVTTLAWDLGEHAAPGQPGVAYALEGSVFATGATVQWLRDELAVISATGDVEPLAASIESSDGVYVVPAFSGMGSPWWDPSARGAVVGLSRGTGRAHLARAAVEAMAFQIRDVVDAMTRSQASETVRLLRVDGGASGNDLLLQTQADQLQAAVARPSVLETTALGTAYLAGLAEGVWSSIEEVAGLWTLERSFHPSKEPAVVDAAYLGWRRAVEKARHWT